MNNEKENIIVKKNSNDLIEIGKDDLNNSDNLENKIDDKEKYIVEQPDDEEDVDDTEIKKFFSNEEDFFADSKLEYIEDGNNNTDEVSRNYNLIKKRILEIGSLISEYFEKNEPCAWLDIPVTKLNYNLYNYFKNESNPDYYDSVHNVSKNFILKLLNDYEFFNLDREEAILIKNFLLNEEDSSVDFDKEDKKIFIDEDEDEDEDEIEDKDGYDEDRNIKKNVIQVKAIIEPEPKTNIEDNSNDRERVKTPPKYIEKIVSPKKPEITSYFNTSVMKKKEEEIFKIVSCETRDETVTNALNVVNFLEQFLTSPMLSDDYSFDICDRKALIVKFLQSNKIKIELEYFDIKVNNQHVFPHSLIIKVSNKLLEIEKKKQKVSMDFGGICVKIGLLVIEKTASFFNFDGLDGLSSCIQINELPSDLVPVKEYINNVVPDNVFGNPLTGTLFFVLKKYTEKKIGLSLT